MEMGVCFRAVTGSQESPFERSPSDGCSAEGVL